MKKRLPEPREAELDMAQQCLSVVIPCYNEIATIETIVQRVLESPFVAEVIIVDDGSSDGTRELLAAADLDTRIRVFLQRVNQGKGAALRRGFAEATGPFVVVQDADLEYDPADYGALLEPLLNGRADVVYGSRFLSGRPHRVLYFWHSVGNRLLTLTSNAFRNLNLTDMETCYKAFRVEVLRTFTIEENRFGVEPEMTQRSPEDRGSFTKSASATPAEPMRRGRRSAGRTDVGRCTASSGTRRSAHSSGSRP